MKLYAKFLLAPVLALGLSACASVHMTEEDRTVNFDFGKATLSHEAKAKLDTIVSTLNRDDTIGAVNIVGYADHIGDAKANDVLSKRRAAAVKSYLSKKGWNYSVVGDTRWVGESQSNKSCGDKANRATIDCLAPSRKVEVEFVSKISEFCKNLTTRHCRQ